MKTNHPIGIFDSGYGGLTVFKSIKAKMPGYDFIYLGDTARAPYGNRSFETVYQYTLQCVEWFFAMGCPLVILACNTASAKALRTIQQKDLHRLSGINDGLPPKRVLGVIRTTAEVIGNYTKTNHIGVLGTKGTINSGSYEIEINKAFPDVKVHPLSCPMWVPLIENGFYNSEGADFFIQQSLDELLGICPEIDTILLACTHYPILLDKIKKHLPKPITIVPQGELVADSLIDYLNRHPEMDAQITKNGKSYIFTTDDPIDFDSHASLFFDGKVESVHLHL